MNSITFNHIRIYYIEDGAHGCGRVTRDGQVQDLLADGRPLLGRWRRIGLRRLVSELCLCLFVVIFDSYKTCLN